MMGACLGINVVLVETEPYLVHLFYFLLPVLVYGFVYPILVVVIGY